MPKTVPIATPHSAAAHLPPRAQYQKVKDYLVQAMEHGRYVPGALMPSEAALVAQFGVSRMTVNRALRELNDAGMVNRVQGVGTFAAPMNRLSSSLTIRDLHEEIESRGHHHHAVVHVQRAETVASSLAPRIGLPEGAAVFHTLIVHFDNGVALQCEDRYVNPARAPGYLDIDFTQITPTQYLLQVAPLWQAQYSIDAAAPTNKEAKLLGIAATEPCLIVQRRTVSRNTPITFARLVHPGGRYSLQGQFKP
jgi:GntR family transcriptional regulator, histidine utilization repressor